MHLVRRVLVSLALLASVASHAQSCSTAGTAVTGSAMLQSVTCTPISAPIGSYVNRTGLTAAMSTQTICDTSSTCPAGFVSLHVYIRPVTTGLTLSSVTGTVSFTDTVGALSGVGMGGAISLLTTTPGFYNISFYHATNTAVTVATTFIAGTGSPSYNFTAQLLWLHS